jgi:DHA1 family bicyclomycin/chloramphenicol resistance-like MFS transporter
LTTVVLISPAISPMIGAILAASAGWRSIFLLLTLLGLMAVAACAGAVRETAAPGRARAGLLSSYARLLSNSRFRRYAIAITASTCALYIFLSGSAFLLIGHYGLSPEASGLCYFLIALCGICGTFVVGFLERRGRRIPNGHDRDGDCRRGPSRPALAGADNLFALMGPMLVLGLAAGVTAPSGMAGAMHSERDLAGTAASLVGALQMLEAVRSPLWSPISANLP